MITNSRSAVGSIASLGWFSRFRNRSLTFGPVIAICLLLSVFPQRYLAFSTLTPADPGSLGLSGTLGQLGAASSIFGGQAAIEVVLRIGASEEVRELVIKRLGLEQRLHKSDLNLHRWLRHKVEVRALRGGVIEIDIKNRDAKLARDLVACYASAIQDRLGQISREQTGTKRDILEKLVREASNGLAQAQARYDDYRLTHKEAIPETDTGTVASRIANLEAGIRGQEIALATAGQIYTDQNIAIQQLRTQKAALEQQLAQARATSPNGTQDVGSVVASTSVLFVLQRELNLQRALYDSYMRFLQGTSVEDLASTANVRILEPPHIDSQRQYSLPPLALAIAFTLLWGVIEFYRLRPPLGARLS